MTFHRYACKVITLAVVTASLAIAFAARAAEPITLTARLAQPLMKSGDRQTNYLRVSLNGCEPQRKTDRTPVNVAFVIDRSGQTRHRREIVPPRRQPNSGSNEYEFAEVGRN